jgi:hypothetical protein
MERAVATVDHAKHESAERPALHTRDTSTRRPGPAADAFALGAPRLQRCACGGGPGPCACEAQPTARVERTLRGPAQPLDTATLAAMQGYFEYAFDGVRVHTGAEADASARSINAVAYTVGSDVVFSGGTYAPHSAAGQRLLAHELAHVVQQDGATTAPGPLEIDWDPASPAEREASSLSDGAASFSSNTNSISSTPSVAVRTARRLQRSEGSPAGGCGVCMGPAAAGSLAHDIIQAEMESLYGRAVFPEVFVPSPTDENGYLDLLTATPTGFAIGEIKPANFGGYLQGDLDLFWYEDQMTPFGLDVERMTLPPPLMSMMFQDPLANGCSQALYCNPPVHGIYTYFCEPDFAELVGTCECSEEEPEPDEEPVDQPVDQPVTNPVPTSPIPFIPPIFVPPDVVPELGPELAPELGPELAPELAPELLPELIEGGAAVEEGITLWEVLEVAAILAL